MSGMMPIVDAHAHYSSRPSTLDVKIHEVDQPITPDGLVSLMDDAGVSEAFQVTRLFQPDDGESLSGAAAHPDRFRVIGRLRAEHVRDPALAAVWLEETPIVGVRVFNHPQGGYSLNRYPDELWEVVASTGVPISIYAPGEIDTIAHVAQRFPRLQLVIDHAGCSVFEWTPLSARLNEWKHMLELSSLPNVAAKASAYPEATGENYPFPIAQDLVREVTESFGSGRVMWGSNYTPARKVGTYSDSVQFARLATAELEKEDQAAVLAHTASIKFAHRCRAASGDPE